MTKEILLAMMMAASVGGIAAPAAAGVEIIVRTAPPAQRYEAIPAARRGYDWAPGYWNWDGRRHVWTAGTWVRERPGYRYNQTQWVQHGNGWRMERGNWKRHDRDHDGIPDRKDRDRDGDGVPNNRDRQPDNPRRN